MAKNADMGNKSFTCNIMKIKFNNCSNFDANISFCLPKEKCIMAESKETKLVFLFIKGKFDYISTLSICYSGRKRN